MLEGNWFTRASNDVRSELLLPALNLLLTETTHLTLQFLGGPQFEFEFVFV
jgi:hypothetical protein